VVLSDILAWSDGASSVSLTIEEWHQQFSRQARWTQGIRTRLYRQAGLRHARLVLDVGCGTGVVTEEIARRTGGQVVGLDLAPAMIRFAADGVDGVQWVVGDAHDLPFPAETFDLVLCNYLLLWTERPEVVVEEMARVARQGGAVLATAEPDYGGRIDFPEDIALGPLMEESLRCEGAHPRIGRRLKAQFVAAGLEVQTWVIPSIWDDQQLRQEFDAEWDFIFKTLNNVADEAQLRKHQERAWRALQAGERLIFMPVFWALGRKPEGDPL
jgi:ubiquinone/menaquinone biosynthesis C-methylase UbiE